MVGGSPFPTTSVCRPGARGWPYPHPLLKKWEWGPGRGFPHPRTRLGSRVAREGGLTPLPHSLLAMGKAWLWTPLYLSEEQGEKKSCQELLPSPPGGEVGKKPGRDCPSQGDLG